MSWCCLPLVVIYVSRLSCSSWCCIPPPPPPPPPLLLLFLLLLVLLLSCCSCGGGCRAIVVAAVAAVVVVVVVLFDCHCLIGIRLLLSNVIWLLLLDLISHLIVLFDCGCVIVVVAALLYLWSLPLFSFLLFLLELLWKNCAVINNCQLPISVLQSCSLHLDRTVWNRSIHGPFGSWGQQKVPESFGTYIYIALYIRIELQASLLIEVRWWMCSRTYRRRYANVSMQACDYACMWMSCMPPMKTHLIQKALHCNSHGPWQSWDVIRSHTERDCAIAHWEEWCKATWDIGLCVQQRKTFMLTDREPWVWPLQHHMFSWKHFTYQSLLTSSQGTWDNTEVPN